MIDSKVNIDEILPCTLWHASLQLRFSYQSTKTVLAEQRHSGPLRVQRAFYPEPTDVCHVLVLHPPAGIAGGDVLQLFITAQQGSHALLTTIGAGKWYGSRQRLAQQYINLKVEDFARLEWLPQESILFNQAYAYNQIHIELDYHASLITWEILAIGRQARQEQFNEGQYHGQLSIMQRQPNQALQLLIHDELVFRGSDAWLASPLGMANHAVLGTLYAMAPLEHRTGLLLDGLIERLYDLCTRLKMPLAVTRLDDLIVIRYLGDDAREALAGFAALRARLRREWYGLEEHFPRIWRT